MFLADGVASVDYVCVKFPVLAEFSGDLRFDPAQSLAVQATNYSRLVLHAE
jgi:hypothetical protein